MTSFPNAPKFLKGAIVALPLPNPIPQVIAFQYNPVTLSRSLQVQAVEGDSNTSEALRLEGAPVEEIKLEVEFDATDQLETADKTAVEQGIYPQLSALETLIYPSSTLVISNQILLSLGTIQIAPPQAPLTLFIWGKKRILPIRLTEFSITEEAHDINLNPIRAKVSLGMRVLSYNDLSVTNPGYHLFLSHQIVKETSANLGRVNNLDTVLGSNLNLL
ncbi:MAG: hypothetical protein AAFR18_09625 [Cyanobacteria bacterium J06627_32]